MDGNRAFDRYVQFAGQFAPMLVAHALVPTLAATCGREFRSSWSLPLKRRTLERHFVFSRDALTRGRWWTCASYMLCHADHAHAAANLQGLVLAGPAAADALGGAGALAAYVAAGVMAALDPPRLSELQLERGFRRRWRSARGAVSSALAPVFSYFDLDAEFLAPPRSLAPTVDAAAETFAGPVDGIRRALGLAERAADGAADRLGALVARRRRLVGASAGVSAFYAVDLCAALEALMAAPDAARGLHAFLHALAAGRYFAGEVTRVWTGNGADGVDHAAHLNGALVGVAAYALGNWWRRRRSRKVSSHGRSGRRSEGVSV